jgi:hypothetical protein
MELKTSEVRFRVSPKEKQAIERQAERAKLSVSEYLRVTALEAKLKRAKA